MPPQPSRDLETDKVIIDDLLDFLPRNQPDIEKITATPEPRLKELTQNSLDILEHQPSLKKLADARKQKKMCHTIKAIFDNTLITDEEFKKLGERFSAFLVKRKLEMTTPPAKPGRPPKRKKGDSQDPELDTAYNYFMKVQKTFSTPSDKAIPASWIRISSTLREPIVFIDTADEPAAKALESAIENNKIQLKITAEITSLKTKGAKVIIKLTDAIQEARFKEEMTSLFPTANMYTPSQRDPMIQLYKIPKNTKIDDLINDLRKFNNFNKDDKIMFHRSYDNAFGNTKNVILRVSPAIRQEVENKRGVLLYKCSTFKAVDYFGILKCARCLQYSHLKSSCASQSICKHCAEHHNSNDCPHQFNSSKFKCASCGKPGHRAIDLRDCEEYLRQLTHAASITNYAYTYIIQD